MNKKEKLAFAVVTTLALTGGGIAFGQTINPVSSDQVINACVTGVNGNITKVSNTQKTCPKGTTPISWNKVGPQGQPGIQGIQGPKGDSGVSKLDELTLINGTDPNSFVLQAGNYICKGGTNLTIGKYGQTSFCFRQIESGGVLVVSDIQGATHLRYPSRDAQLHILPGACPKFSEGEFPNFHPDTFTMFLVPGAAPVGYTLSGTSSCILIDPGMENGVIQIAFKVM